MSASLTSKSPSSSKRRRSEASMQLDQTSSDISAKPTPFKGEKPEPALHDHQPSKSAPKASKKARVSSRIARDPQPAASTFPDGGGPSYPLARVFHIVKMDNESVRISREAVFVMALAAEEITRRITRAASDSSGNVTEDEVTVPRIASAISKSLSLSILSGIIPEAVPLSFARQSRLSNEVAVAADPVQIVLSRIKDQLHPTITNRSLVTSTKIAGAGITNVPIAQSSQTGVSNIKSYSQREARAVANSKRSHRGASATTSMPLVPAMPLHTVALPAGFDYRNLPIPPPGMVFQLPPGLNSELYRNGIQWVAANPSVANGTGAQSSDGLIGGHSAGNGPIPAKIESASKQPRASPTAPVKRSASTRNTTSQQGSQEHGAARAKEKQSVVVAGSAEVSTFHPGRLQGRTIYNAGLKNAAASDGPAEIETNPSGNDEEAANVRPSKKPRRTRGRTSGARKAGGDDTE